MTKESAFIYWLATSKISYNKYILLKNEYNDLGKLFYNTSLIKNSKILTDKQKAALITRADEKLINSEIKKLFSEKIGITTIVDSNYPKPLSNISIPPLLLYYKGNISVLSNNKISVVGTRSCTRISFNNTVNICTELSRNNITIVSGIALGIDTAALTGGLNGGTPCISVLGNGFNYRYPAQNAELYDKIQKEGLLITEYPPNTPPFANNFPKRNRIISGLSQGILISHAPIKSGAAITLNHAVSENKDIFAIPGNINEEGSVLPNLLISEGAIPVTSAQDILDFYGWNTNKRNKIIKNTFCELDFCEQQLYTLLKQGELNIDELARLADISISKVSLILTNMELKGIVMRLPGNVFGLKI